MNQQNSPIDVLERSLTLLNPSGSMPQPIQRMYLPIANGSVEPAESDLAVIELIAGGTVEVGTLNIRSGKTAVVNKHDWGWHWNVFRLMRALSVNGQLPKPGETDSSDDESPLGVWLARQRSAHEAGTLPPERERRLRSVEEHWSVPQTANRAIEFRNVWSTHADRVATYRLTHGTLPNAHHTDDSPLAHLGKWLAGQRLKASQGELSEEQLHTLDSIDPAWRSPLSLNWEQHANRLARFIAEHGRHPQGVESDGSDAIVLAEWLRCQRTTHNSGKLLPERVARLNEIAPTWAYSREQRWDAKLEQLAAFASEHRRLPQRDEGLREDTATTIGEWLHAQRNEFSKGTLSAERITKLDTAAPNWRPRSRRQR